MDESSLRGRVRHWLMHHGLFELLKFLFIPAFVWLISLGITRIRHANLDTAFNIFVVIIGVIGILWLLGIVRLPTVSKKEEPTWEVFFYSPGLAASLSPSIGRVIINLQFLSTKSTELIYLHITLRNNKGANLDCEKSEPITVGAMQMSSVMIDKKFPPQELASFERGEMVNLDGYAKFRDGDSMKQFRISIATIPSV
jgi:hypothetical protein